MAFREAFQALGWINGRNVRIDYRWVTSDIDRLGLAKEVAEQQPDVIVAETTPAVAALSRVNSTIPIVFVNVSDPIGGGFVGSLGRPGGVITGFISNEPTLGSKWPGLLKEIAPAVERLGFLFNPDTAPYADLFLRQAEAAAVSLGLKLSASPIHNDPEIEHTIITLTSAPRRRLDRTARSIHEYSQRTYHRANSTAPPAHYLHVPVPSRRRRFDILRD